MNKESLKNIQHCYFITAKLWPFAQESYRAGVSSLDAEWKRVTKMVDERKHKLSEWSVSLHKYEEVYVGTVRSCEDLSHEVSKLEESVLEGTRDGKM